MFLALVLMKHTRSADVHNDPAKVDTFSDVEYSRVLNSAHDHVGHTHHLYVFDGVDHGRGYSDTFLRCLVPSLVSLSDFFSDVVGHSHAH